MALDADSTTVHDNRLHLAKDNMSRKRDKERERDSKIVGSCSFQPQCPAV